jgi:prepilin-type N-terminal cleavage/methylation domain-containing protein
MRIRNEKGLTLIELIITISLIALVSAIAVPLINSQTSRAHLAAAQSDVRNAGLGLAGESSRYFSFGSANGVITHDPATERLVLSPMTNAQPVATGPGADRIQLTLSPNSTITGSYASGTDLRWCLAVTNRTKTAVMNETGLKKTATGCNTDGTIISD